MRYVELCFHESDATAADLAARGLTEAGLCVLRRPVSDERAPAPSPATRSRIVLHTDALDALPATHPVFAADAMPSTIDVPLGERWPLRASRPRMVAPAMETHLRAGRFWKVVAWAASQPIPDRDRRISAQTSIFRALRDVPGEDAVLRPRPRFLDRFTRGPVVAAHAPIGWETAAPLAAVATLLVAAGVSSVFVDLQSREDAAEAGLFRTANARAADGSLRVWPLQAP